MILITENVLYVNNIAIPRNNFACIPITGDKLNFVSIQDPSVSYVRDLPKNQGVLKMLIPYNYGETPNNTTSTVFNLNNYKVDNIAAFFNLYNSEIDFFDIIQKFYQPSSGAAYLPNVVLNFINFIENDSPTFLFGTSYAGFTCDLLIYSASDFNVDSIGGTAYTYGNCLNEYFEGGGTLPKIIPIGSYIKCWGYSNYMGAQRLLFFNHINLLNFKILGYCNIKIYTYNNQL